MNNKVKISQLAVLLITIIPGGKYLSLPVILANQVGRDSWVVVLSLLVIDMLCLAFLLWAVRNNVNRYNLVTILSKSVGKVVCKIVLVLMFLLISMRMVTLITGMYKLFAEAFSIKTNWIGYIIPLIIMMLFLVNRGFRTIARLNEIFATLIILAILSVIITPLVMINKSNLLPVMMDGAVPILKAMLGNNFWFSDYIFIYFVLSDIKQSKKVFSPVLGGFAVGGALSVLLNMLFIALYGTVAPHKDLAMSTVSQFAVFATSKGRLDWLALSLWSLSVFIKLAVLAYSLYQCTKYIFKVNCAKMNWWCIIPVILLCFLPLFFGSDTILDVGLKTLNFPFLIVKYAMPLSMPLLVAIANKRSDKHSLLGGELT